MKKSGNWIERLVNSVDRNMNLETIEGVQRGGRISGFTFRKFWFNNREQHVPTEIEINGDPNDRVDVSRILRIVIN